jgi:SAM-dependent methyltransferase
MEWLLRKAKAARPGAKTLLDVGAASGMLVRAAEREGLTAEGVEPSESLVQRGIAQGAKLHAGVLPHPALGDRKFDIVMLADVIEHVRDPVELLRLARAHVAESGVMLVVTPDVSSVAARLLGPRWWHLRLAHVGYFDDRSFEAACAAAGMQIVDTARAKWFFKAGYLAERTERYLPTRPINRLGRALPGVRRAYEQVIPLNLFDSTLFVLRPTGA